VYNCDRLRKAPQPTKMSNSMSTQQEQPTQSTQARGEATGYWSILLLKEGEQWIALTLERSVVWWADTALEAITGLADALVWRAEADQGYGQTPFSLSPPAPEQYWELYRKSTLSIQLQDPAIISGEVRLGA
jgi:hypothetical protein